MRPVPKSKIAQRLLAFRKQAIKERLNALLRRHKRKKRHLGYGLKEI